jgi:hypothetical protein
MPCGTKSLLTEKSSIGAKLSFIRSEQEKADRDPSLCASLGVRRHRSSSGKPPNDDDARKPKLTDHQKREAIIRRDWDGKPVREIARSYNVSHSTISRLA